MLSFLFSVRFWSISVSLQGLASQADLPFIEKLWPWEPENLTSWKEKPRKIKWRLINFFYWSYILTIVVKSAKNSTDRKFTRRNSTQAILQNLYIYLISSSPSVYGIIILCLVFPKLYFCYWLYGINILCFVIPELCFDHMVSISCVLYFLNCISVIWYKYFVFPK